MLTVFQNRRWDGDMLTLQRLLADGVLGRVVRFESRYERWRPEVRGDAWRERDSPEEAGGLLFDLGSHLVDQAILLFGPPVSVYAELDRRRPGALVDDDFFMSLEHHGGVHSHLSATMLAALPQARMRALGLAGAFVKNGLDPQEAALRHGERPGGTGWGEEARENWGRLAADEKVLQIETEPGAYQRFYEGVVESLTSGAPPPVDPADSVAVIEVLEAARESAGAGQVLRLT
jgi:predicted dehydrogenase